MIQIIITMTTTETVTSPAPYTREAVARLGRQCLGTVTSQAQLDKQSSGQHDYTYVPAEETVSSSITSYI